MSHWFFLHPGEDGKTYVCDEYWEDEFSPQLGKIYMMWEHKIPNRTQVRIYMQLLPNDSTANIQQWAEQRVNEDFIRRRKREEWEREQRENDDYLLDEIWGED